MKYEQVLTTLKKTLTNAGAYPLAAQAKLCSEILGERLELVLPWAMEASGFDMWIVVSRENCEDPIIKTLFTWDMPKARRISILAFHRDQTCGVVRKMSIGFQSSEMSRFYENVQKKDESVWQTLSRIISETDPQRIAVNRSSLYGFCDGLSATLYEEIQKNLAPQYTERIFDGEELTVRWLQRVTPLEMRTLKAFAQVTHAIIDYAFGPDFVRPGVTTTTDIEWCMRNLISDTGYQYWFGPDVDLQRDGSNTSRMFNTQILPGDLIHCDVGITGLYVHLHTDMQWVAYVLKQGEQKAPADLETLFDKGNRFREIVMREMQLTKTGNEVFHQAIEEGKKAGINPMLYTHPVGTFGHGAGAMIGLYTNQGFVAGAGERMLEDKTCYALELNVYDNLPCWGGQNVFMYLEEDICYDGKPDYIDGHQEKLMLI